MLYWFCYTKKKVGTDNPMAVWYFGQQIFFDFVLGVAGTEV